MSVGEHESGVVWALLRTLLVLLLTTVAFRHARAAVGLVQHTGRDAGTTTSSTLAFATNNTAGNFIAVAVRAGRTGQDVTVSDARGNTYRRALQVNATLDAVTLGIYYAENIAGGANTVTVTDTLTGGSLRFAIFEYSGVATSSALDGTPVMAEGTSAAMSSGPVTTTASGDLVLGLFSTAEAATFTAGAGAVIQERVPAAPGTKLAVQDLLQASAGPISAQATMAAAQPWAAAVAAFRAGGGGGTPVPDLTITKSHTGSFTQGQTGASYTLTARNVGAASTAGIVTVTDTLPSGLTATAFAGTGWSCILTPLSCTRSDVLDVGGSYPALTLTVNVSASAPASVTNAASVAGGGQTNTGNDAATDPTTIISIASLLGQWSAVQNWPIVAVHAALLPTGEVLAWTDYTTNSGAQIWRRGTNTFTPKTYSPVSLFCAGHAYLPDGRLMVAGGIIGLLDDMGPRESTFFNPATESWSAGPLMQDGRYYPTTTTLPDGRILVAGGTTTCSTCFADDIEIYDPATNVWTPLAASAQHTFKYYPHLYVLPDGRILVAAQDDRAIPTEVLDLTTQTWTTIDARLIDGHSSVMYLPGKVMKCGRATADNPGQPSLATTYVLDTAQPSPAWEATGSMASPRSHHNLTILPDGQVLVTGGGRTTDKSDFATAVSAAELWNPTSRTWSTMASAQNPRLYHSTALLLPDATVLVAGGGRQNGRSQPDPKDQSNAEIYSPPYLFRGPRPVIGSAPPTVGYGASFQVTTPDAGRVASVSLIPLGAATHSFNETQRYVPLTFTAQAGAITVTGPASGRIAPPGPYMLFLVDTAGVPSVAAMVRVAASPAPLPVQQAGRDAGTTTSGSLAFPQANTAGNFIAVAIRAGRQGQSFTVTDTRGNTYRRALQVNETLDTVTLGVYYAENIAGGVNTVTVSDTLTGGTLRFSIFEYSGIATSNALDGTPVMAEGTSGTPSSGSITTSAAGDLIFGMVSTADNATYTAGSGFTLEQQVPGVGAAKLAVVDRIQPAAGAIAATATISPSQAWGAAVAAFRRSGGGPTPVPDLTIAKAHAGSFTQGQSGASYAITVSNAGTAPTAGTVTVVDSLPSGLTATALSGTGWSCTLGSLTCTRSDALAAAASYPAITLTVSVSASAPASVTNSVAVSGGGQTNTGNDAASDPTTVLAPGVPDLVVSKSHVGSFTQGQAGATYTITVSNAGTASTSGTVTVVDSLPAGLSATALAGTGWSCTLGALTCTRTTALAASSSYPVITLTVTVSASAPASVTNSASVSGGGETNTTNDTASDPTSITPSGGGPATVTLVQQAGRDAGTTTSSTLAFPAANTAGNFILVAIRAGQQGQSFTVTDTRGNTYQRALQASLSLDAVTLGLYYAESIAGGANTVTVSDTVTGGSLRFSIFEYAGITTVGALDGAARMAEGTSATASSGSITTLTSGDLIFGMVSTSENATYTAGSGFTLRQLVPATGGAKLGTEDRTQAAAGSIAATLTISPSQAWGAAIAAFRAATAPGATAPRLVINSPAEGAALPGSTVQVAYKETGDLTEVNHVHYQLDSGPVVMDLTLDGVFQFTGLHVGAHTLNGVLVRADHSTIAGSDAVPVHFTTIVDPADPVAPTVQITAPTGGTVSGVVTIAANASDNLGVYGVQFRVDGVGVGAEDLVAPYSTDWNTAVASNGVHTLSAIARDAAGRETTSATVTVTVSNVSPTDPSVIGQFAGPFSWPLVSVHAILLPTGKVLLFDDHTTSAGVQVWNPATNTLTARPYNARNLFCAGHTLLPDGRVLVVGGHSAAYVGIPDATLFDPATETWTAAASMSQPRWYPTATSLPDGRVLAISGADDCPTCVDPNGSHQGIALVPEVYDPQTNAWARLNGASLSLPLYPHMHVLPDGRVLAVATQEDPIVSRALDVASQSWTVVDPVARDGGSSVMFRPGKILKTGMGRNPDYTPVPSSSTAYVMDTTVPSPTWRTVASMSFARTQHNLVVLPDGNVLAVGGSTNSNVFDTPGCVKTAEMWSPVSETWTPMATMQEPRHYHSTAILLPDGRVLVAGGGRFGPDFPSAEIYSPPYLFRGARPAITSVAPTIQFGGHLTVGTPDGARIAKVTLLRLGAPTHAFDENQRYVELAFAPVAGGLDVTGPTSPNVVLPGHYMLFLVDTSGVPSIGSIVRFPPPWEDTVAPTAPSGLTGTASPGKIDLSWSAASDNTGVTLYNVHRGTVPGFVRTAGNRVGQAATTALRDTGFTAGNYVYVVTAQDAAGNVSAPSNELSVFLQADSTAPSVSVTAPSPGATVSGVVNVTASASDDVGVSGVQFLLDGGSLGVEDTAAPYGINWNSATTPNGPHILAARARDAAGNTTTSATVAGTVSNSAPSSLVAAYAFGEGSGNQSADATGQGHTLTVGGATWTPSGKTGSALSFNGTSARSTIADANDLDLSSAMTLMAWVNPSVAPSGWRTILHKETDRYYLFAGSAGPGPAGGGTFGSGNVNAFGPSALPVGAWTHLAMTYDGGTVRVYVNATLVASAPATGGIGVSSSPLSIGGTAAYGEFFSGRIDDVRIYSRALTPLEIEQDMAQPVVAP
jgi:uncharacterized repeat protein (TIGR01451 family)